MNFQSPSILHSSIAEIREETISILFSKLSIETLLILFSRIIVTKFCYPFSKPVLRDKIFEH